MPIFYRKISNILFPFFLKKSFVKMYFVLFLRMEEMK